MKGKNDKSWKKKRKINYLPEKTYFYLFSEGTKTEPYYFTGFKKLIESNPIYKDMVQIKILPCGDNTVHVLEMAEKYVSKNRIKVGEVWCIYDKDDFPADRFDAVNDSINARYNEDAELNYYAAWSNECFEFWFVLHFEDYQSNNHRTSYYKYLNEKFRKLKIGDYQKNKKDIFDVLIEYGNPCLAIRYAKRIIERNTMVAPSKISPGTKVYELVEHMSKYLPAGYIDKFIEKSDEDNCDDPT